MEFSEYERLQEDLLRSFPDRCRQCYAPVEENKNYCDYCQRQINEIKRKRKHKRKLKR